VTVAEALVQKLRKANEAEIELAQMAEEMSDNQEVKQLAATLIQDHRALNEKLERLETTKLSGVNNTGNRLDDNRSSLENRRQPGVDQTDTLDTNTNRSANLPVASTPNQPNTSGANTTINASGENTSNRQHDLRTAGTPNTETDTSQLGEVNQQPYERDVRSMRSTQADSASQRVPQQLCTIAEQACDNATQMTKEMLRGYEGQDFNMAFLGQQCVAHTMMLAELKAISSEGPEELRSIANEAASKVKSHLDETKRLAKKFEDDRSNSSQRRLSNAG